MKGIGKTGAVFLAVILGFSSGVYAQDDYERAAIGVRLLPTVSNLDAQTVGGEYVKSDFVVGFGYGVLLEANVTRHIGVNTEIIYNSLRQEYEDRGRIDKIRVEYINVPVLFSLNTSKARRLNFNLVVGPQMGFNVGSRVNTTQDNPEEPVEAIIALKTGDFALAYGAGAEFMNERRTLRFDLGFRGVYGLVDVSQQNQHVAGNYYIFNSTNIENYSLYFGLTFML